MKTLLWCRVAAQAGRTILMALLVVIAGQLAGCAKSQPHGCTHTVLYNEENFVDRVQELTDGNGVDAVYDSVGRDTFHQSLDCLRTRGTLVLWSVTNRISRALYPVRVPDAVERGTG